MKRGGEGNDVRAASGLRSVMGVVGVTKKSCSIRAGWRVDGVKGTRCRSRTRRSGLLSSCSRRRTSALRPKTSTICGACRLGGKSVCWIRSITSLRVNSGTLLLRRVPWRVGKMERKEAISRGHSTRASRMGEPLDPWKQN